MPRSRPRHSLLLAPTTMRRPAGRLVPALSPREPALGWIHEALERDPDYFHRRMFGCDAAYLGGSLYLVTAAKREPWNGLLVCTSLERQGALRTEWPALSPHKVLGKWLYLSQRHADFERIAGALTKRAAARDDRLGVRPKPRRGKRERNGLRP